MKRIFDGLMVIALLFAPALSSAAGRPELSDLKSAKLSIVNFQIVKSGEIYRGARPDQAGLAALANLQVKTIIDLQGGDIRGSNPLVNIVAYFAEPSERESQIIEEVRHAEQVGIEVIRRPLNSMDHVTREDARVIDSIVDLVNERKTGSVYVHCAHGRDRTGLIIALYRIKYEGFSPEAAFEEMRQYGHRGFINHIVTGQLDKFFWKAAPLYAKSYRQARL